MLRQPPKHWIDMLGEWGRPKDRMAHLDIWWDPDCSRWLLMECVPPHGVSDELRLALLTYPDKTPFRRRQSAHYKEHGKIPLAFWIIQGEHGGHRLEYGEHEQTLAQWYGGSREPPAPGSLPYAAFDHRVLDALAGYDRVMSKFSSLTAAYEGDAKAALEQMRIDMLAGIDDSMRDVARDAAGELSDMDLPVVDGPPPDFEQMYDTFVTTGTMPGAAGSLSPGGAVTVPFTP
jgi:hypothetical protein